MAAPVLLQRMPESALLSACHRDRTLDNSELTQYEDDNRNQDNRHNNAGSSTSPHRGAPISLA